MLSRAHDLLSRPTLSASSRGSQTTFSSSASLEGLTSLTESGHMHSSEFWFIPMKGHTVSNGKRHREQSPAEFPGVLSLWSYGQQSSMPRLLLEMTCDSMHRASNGSSPKPQCPESVLWCPGQLPMGLSFSVQACWK